MKQPYVFRIKREEKRFSNRNKLVSDPFVLKELLKGGLMHMVQEDTGELCSMVGLYLLDGEGEACHHPSSEFH